MCFFQLFQDFETLKGNWSLLCNKDSDGDMKSNGEELGDPHCVWSKGKKPEGPATSHPGKYYECHSFGIIIFF